MKGRKTIIKTGFRAYPEKTRSETIKEGIAVIVTVIVLCTLPVALSYAKLMGWW